MGLAEPTKNNLLDLSESTGVTRIGGVLHVPNQNNNAYLVIDNVGDRDLADVHLVDDRNNPRYRVVITGPGARSAISEKSYLTDKEKKQQYRDHTMWSHIIGFSILLGGAVWVEWIGNNHIPVSLIIVFLVFHCFRSLQFSFWEPMIGDYLFGHVIDHDTSLVLWEKITDEHAALLSSAGTMTESLNPKDRENIIASYT